MDISVIFILIIASLLKIFTEKVEINEDDKLYKKREDIDLEKYREVIIYENGNDYWTEASWGIADPGCTYNILNEAKNCVINPGYGAVTYADDNNSYGDGIFVIEMKVNDPTIRVQIIFYHLNDEGQNTPATPEVFEATTEFNTYKFNIIIPNNHTFFRIGVQNYSGDHGNTYSIKSMKYYEEKTEGSVDPTPTPIPSATVVIFDNGKVESDWSKDWGWSSDCNIIDFSASIVCDMNVGYPALGFRSRYSYSTKGKLVVEMKTESPTAVKIMIKHGDDSPYNDIKILDVTSEFKKYEIDFSSSLSDQFDFVFIQKYVVDESNRFTIKSVIYYVEGTDIPTTTIKPTSTSTNSTTKPTSNVGVIEDNGLNESDINKLGYDYCTQMTTKVEYVDDEGMWGIEDKNWCIISTKNINECWSNLYGYQCCSSSAVQDPDNLGWGTENNNKCGYSNKDNCLSEAYGYPCCKKSTVKIVFVDETGAYGIEDDQWCGIF